MSLVPHLLRATIVISWYFALRVCDIYRIYHKFRIKSETDEKKVPKIFLVIREQKKILIPCNIQNMNYLLKGKQICFMFFHNNFNISHHYFVVCQSRLWEFFQISNTIRKFYAYFYSSYARLIWAPMGLVFAILYSTKKIHIFNEFQFEYLVVFGAQIWDFRSKFVSNVFTRSFPHYFHFHHRWIVGCEWPQIF